MSKGLLVWTRYDLHLCVKAAVVADKIRPNHEQ